MVHPVHARTSTDRDLDTTIQYNRLIYFVVSYLILKFISAFYFRAFIFGNLYGQCLIENMSILKQHF